MTTTNTPSWNSNTVWHPPHHMPSNGLSVWFIEKHQKGVVPQSFTIQGGWIEHNPDGQGYRISQNDENGCGWCSWYPANANPQDFDEFVAWASAEDFQPLPDFVL
jgi:hypothetical protein